MNLNVTRRNALRGLGTLLALPWMESLASAAPSKNAALPRRFVGMYHTNGVNPWKWYPTSAGRDYVMPENLALLKDLREDLTVFSGLAHFRSPQSAGHWGLSNLLTGCGNGGGVKFHTSVSLDQYLAPHIGNSTRIPSLNLSCKTGVGALNESDRDDVIRPTRQPASHRIEPANGFRTALRGAHRRGKGQIPAHAVA